MNVITRGIRGAGRNAIRAFAIIVILGVSLGLSLVMLIADKNINHQIESTLSAIGTTVNILPNDFNGGALDMGRVEKVNTVPHVAQFTMELNRRLLTTGNSGEQGDSAAQNISTSLRVGSDVATGKASPNNSNPRIIGITYPLEIATTQRIPSFHLVSGSSFDGRQPHNQALLSTLMASRNNLTVGSTFVIADETFTVAGLYKTETTESTDRVDRRVVITSLPTAQRVTQNQGKIDGAVAIVDSLRNLASTTSAIDTTLQGLPVDIQSQQDQADAALQPLVSVHRISRYSLVGAVIGSALIILLTMIMIVRERRREIGILKAIGLTNRRIITQYMVEALTFTIGGAAIGIALGAVAGSTVSGALVTNATSPANAINVTSGASKSAEALRDTIAANLAHTSAQLDWAIVLFGLGAAIMLALVGSALAALIITKVRPADVLRSE